MVKTITYLGCACLGMGVGCGMTLAFFLADNPSIIIQDQWRTVTTAPPVTYVPETPFHVDPKVICDTSVPATPTPTRRIPPPATTTTTKAATTTTAVPPETTTTATTTAVPPETTVTSATPPPQ